MIAAFIFVPRNKSLEIGIAGEYWIIKSPNPEN